MMLASIVKLRKYRSNRASGRLTPTTLRWSALSPLRVKRAFNILTLKYNPLYAKQRRVVERSNDRVSRLAALLT